MADDLGFWLRDQIPARFGACSIGEVCDSCRRAGDVSDLDVAGTAASNRRIVVMKERRVACS